MTELNLELNQTAENEIKKLMEFYQVKTRAELITKALAVLRVAAIVRQTEGKLIARKGDKETTISVN